ncbi:hypothetical protein SH611_00255 [Geminicoccaceae bacterium 1502E]|nr:hypothetical protein [Geminicoccaceae bacterium 1502E]
MLHFLYTPYTFTKGSYGRYEDANAEIVKHGARVLGGLGPVHVSSFHAGRITDRPEDALLGHPTWGPPDLACDWMRDNALAEDAAGHPNAYVIMPWVPRFPREWHMPFIDRQLRAARRIFGLCGAHWAEETRALDDGSLQHEVSGKLVAVNMGCTAELLPFRERRRVGARPTLLHVSHLGSYKRFDRLLASIHGLDVRLCVATRSLPRGLLNLDAQGVGRVQIHCLGVIDNADPGFNRFVAEEVDFYIHTSDLDAQATAVLEAAARGVVPMVTPESGFRSPFAIHLCEDPAHNREIIARALAMPEAEYRERAQGLRRQILEEHGWEHVFGTIWRTIAADLASVRAAA